MNFNKSYAFSLKTGYNTVRTPAPCRVSGGGQTHRKAHCSGITVRKTSSTAQRTQGSAGTQNNTSPAERQATVHRPTRGQGEAAAEAAVLHGQHTHRHVTEKRELLRGSVCSACVQTNTYFFSYTIKLYVCSYKSTQCSSTK